MTSILEIRLMNKKGREILKHLEIFQLENSLGCVKMGHNFSKNGTISCIRCGMIKF
jgi:hypothetical protein